MDAISTLNGFEAERERWDRLYEADPGAQVFISWPWLRAYLGGAPRNWTILLVRDGDELVAALPLRIAGVPSSLLPVARQLAFASAPVADYQGMLCRPGREREALRILADAVRALPWDVAWFSDVCDPRIIELLASLRAHGDHVETTLTTRCPRTALPDTFDAFARSLSSSTRWTTLRSVRRLAADLPAFRVTSPDSLDIDAHIDAIVRLNHMRWGGNLRRSQAKYGSLHRAAYDQGCLRMIVMWDGDRPIAGSCAYVDPVRGTYNLYQLVYDSAYGKYSPGKGAVGLAVRDAIEHGYRVFDFLRGYEEYKLAYAKDVATTTHHLVRRHGLRSAVYSAIQPAYRTMKQAAVRVVYGPGRTV